MPTNQTLTHISTWSLLNAKNETRSRFTGKLKLWDTQTIKINMKWQKEECERAVERQKLEKWGRTRFNSCAMCEHTQKMVVWQQNRRAIKTLLFCFRSCFFFFDMCSEFARAAQLKSMSMSWSACGKINKGAASLMLACQAYDSTVYMVRTSLNRFTFPLIENYNSIVSIVCCLFALFSQLCLCASESLFCCLLNELNCNVLNDLIKTIMNVRNCGAITIW